MMNSSRTEIARTTLAVLFIGVLIAASGWILRPFLPALIWATMVVVATWPVMLRVQRHLGNRRAPAVMVMTVLVLLVLVVPLSLAIATLVDNAPQIVSWGRFVATFEVPPPPDWVPGLPLIGHKLDQAWMQLAVAGTSELTAKIAPYAGNLTKWFAREVGSFGLVFVQFLLTVALSAVLYSSGEKAADEARRFGRRLAGERGEGAVVLAAQAVRAVALGVGITAFVQSVLGGIGLAIAGVPFATVLTALMFMLCIAQLGPTLLLAPAVVWLYWSGDTGWGTFLLVWTVIVGTMDNFLRPLLIKQGADLPLLLILAGVIGGLLAFGLVGIFVGPVVLAVSYTLLEAWLRDGPILAEAASANSARSPVAEKEGQSPGG
ncbi:MAG: putative inner membrane protein [Candidatus Accumulibacter appositus]|uniref:Putative inner membrane protein n=2 Tax=Candidatus Accumulibacter TaxID=327159 RepID=A0A011PLL2_9PROT|nr:MAG: putative inner membrane protein [Candidatus Accumulibacter appositus]